jgi:Icc protein
LPCAPTVSAEAVTDSATDNSVDGSVLLVQLSDSHLFADAGDKLLGMNTHDSLQRVIERVLDEQANIDLVLASGDLSQDGSPASYQRFRQMLEQIPAPARWFPGNHDDLAIMQAACQGSSLLQPVVDLGNWRIVLLDTSIAGAVPGFLAADQLELLASALQNAGSRHVLVTFHHHPVSIGCLWMEPIGLRNPDALFAVLDAYPQVRALLWGHIHQEFDQLRNGVRLLASPSTCVQFAPGSEEFQVDQEAPGYRWLRLHADGRLDTGVSRVTGIPFEVDYSVRGY